jgi:hypothetical protein
MSVFMKTFFLGRRYLSWTSITEKIDVNSWRCEKFFGNHRVQALEALVFCTVYSPTVPSKSSPLHHIPFKWSCIASRLSSKDHFLPKAQPLVVRSVKCVPRISVHTLGSAACNSWGHTKGILPQTYCLSPLSLFALQYFYVHQTGAQTQTQTQTQTCRGKDGKCDRDRVKKDPKTQKGNLKISSLSPFGRFLVYQHKHVVLQGDFCWTFAFSG